MHISEIKVLGKDPIQQEKGFGLQGELQVQLLQGRSGAADDLRVRAMLACLQEDSFPPSEDTGSMDTLRLLRNFRIHPNHTDCQKRSPFNFLTLKNTFQET